MHSILEEEKTTIPKQNNLPTAGTTRPDSLAQVVKANYDSIKSFSTKFTELNYKKSSNESEDLSGKLYYDAIGRISLLYTEPEGDFLIIDGTSVTLQRYGKKQHLDTGKQSHKTIFYTTILHAVNGDVQTIADELDANIRSRQDNKYYNFSLKRRNTHKAGKHDITKVQLRYNLRTGALAYINITDGAGNTNTIALQHPQINNTIPESVFNTKR